MNRRTVFEQKQAIRDTIAQLCNNLPDKHKRDMHARKLLRAYHASLKKVRYSKKILSYKALSDEIDLEPLHTIWREEGASVHIARNNPRGLLEFDPAIASFELLKHGLCIVPGRAFTLDGCRLGRGGGVYDRFLAAHPQLVTVSIAYDFQILDSIPMTRYDCKIGKILV